MFSYILFVTCGSPKAFQQLDLNWVPTTPSPLHQWTAASVHPREQFCKIGNVSAENTCNEHEESILNSGYVYPPTQLVMH